MAVLEAMAHRFAEPRIREIGHSRANQSRRRGVRHSVVCVQPPGANSVVCAAPSNSGVCAQQLCGVCSVRQPFCGVCAAPGVDPKDPAKTRERQARLNHPPTVGTREALLLCHNCQPPVTSNYGLPLSIGCGAARGLPFLPLARSNAAAASAVETRATSLSATMVSVWRALPLLLLLLPPPLLRFAIREESLSRSWAASAFVAGGSHASRPAKHAPKEFVLPPWEIATALREAAAGASSDDDRGTSSSNNSSTSSTSNHNHTKKNPGVVVTGLESTPNPSSFVLRLGAPLPGLERLEGGLRGETYYAAARKNRTPPPASLARLLRLEGMDFVFAMATVLTVNKKSSAQWEVLLPSVLEALLEDSPTKDEQLGKLLKDFLTLESQPLASEPAALPTTSGQVAIRIQTCYNFPLQIEGKGSLLGTTLRKKLPQPKFSRALEDLQSQNPSLDFFRGRVWTDKGVRYLPEDNKEDDVDGDDESKDNFFLPLDDSEQERLEIERVLEAEALELDASYSQERLARMLAELANTKEKKKDDMQTKAMEATAMEEEEGMPDMESIDLEAVDEYCDACEAGNVRALAVLVRFVSSRKGNLPARRNALAYLGGTAGSEHWSEQQHERVVEAVLQAFSGERSPAMRRTAGDALSDLGDPRAVPAAAAALREDKSPLVKWRAARVLGELADSKAAAEVLQETLRDDDKLAFEVEFEVRDALRKVQARLETGSGNKSQATGPMWKQIREGTLRLGDEEEVG